MSSGRSDLVLGICAFIGFIGIWALISAFEIVPQRFLPLPWKVVAALYYMLVERNFIEDIWISVARVWSAFLLSVVMAIPIGMWMSNYRIVGTLLEPIIDFIRYLPVPALVPLLIIWFGIAANSGIGHVIWSARRFVKTPEVMAGILTVGIIGLATDQAIRVLHRRYFRYL
jgi:NitT/TauT family transport system permease protein